ncbi:MAG: hypothetical protein IPN34_00810 [Planctomycetes bacterium]|nr:hypothetical protein [Planctomycetota bacterium]
MICTTTSRRVELVAFQVAPSAAAAGGDRMTSIRMHSLAAVRGRAEVGLLWVIFSFLLLLAVGFLAFDASSRVEESQSKLGTIEKASADQLAQLEYYTALVHHAASVLPSSAWSGSRRNPSAGDIAGFLLQLDRDTAGLQAASEPVANLMAELRKSAENLAVEYDRVFKKAAQGEAEDEEEAAAKRKREEQWLARDQMKDLALLLAFSLPRTSFSEYDMLSKREQDALDATAKTAAQAAPYAVSYLSALVRAMATEYSRLYDENQRLANDLYQAGAGRVAQLVSARETFEDSFRNSSSGITKATRDVVDVDQGTAFQVSLDTVRSAQAKIKSALEKSIEGTSEVYSEMGGPYLAAVQTLRDAEQKLAKFERRSKELDQKLASIVEDERVLVPAIDGRVIKVAPLRGSVYIDLNAYHHIDLGMRFEVFGVSPENRIRGELNTGRVLLGSIQVTEVGRKGATSTARITRVVEDSRASWALWEGALLVNRRYDPDYAPKVALLGSFKGFLSRETLADHLRDHNYVVQEAPGYDTDVVIRGNGGLAVEPTVDGLSTSSLGIRTVAMRRMLRMLGLEIQD